MKFLAELCAVLLTLNSWSVCFSQNESTFPVENVEVGETLQYLNALEAVKDQDVPDQISTWREYVRSHPHSPFLEEIESNLENLEALIGATDPAAKKEQLDTDMYLKAVEFSKRLSSKDQTLLWEQFIRENPESIYLPEAQTTLETLRSRGDVKKKDQTEVETEDAVGQTFRLSPDLPFLSERTGVILATFAGLAVPGMGHWYAKEYTVAGFLTGLRVLALGVGVSGLLKRSQGLIVGGSVLYGAGYLVDAVDTPFAVRRYNEELERTGKKTSLLFQDQAPRFAFAYTFTF